MYIYIFAPISSFFPKASQVCLRQIQSTSEQIHRILSPCRLSFIPLFSVLLVKIRHYQMCLWEREYRINSLISALLWGLYVAYNL